jgi:Asp-tRNA(Asn)/Glu-tRNA(Gln) amidotransferase A subunit family amidase
MSKTMPHTLSATEAAAKIRQGLLSSRDLVKACLARIDETDPQIRAWTHLNPEQALVRADELDEIRRAGRPTGPLHGVPVGLKDIIDTRDFPTERGSAVFAGRQPDRDAALVQRLHGAGAVILGKTVTTEFAFMHPSETRNPHNPEHSPGGSSSGSAAAVAAFQVPLAIGTQTNGSVIRPASFCGTYGFKPTRGVISRRGVLQTSQSLDQVGVFGRSIEDVALLADVLAAYDADDPKSYPRPRPQMRAGAGAEPLVDMDFVIFDLPYLDRLAGDASAGFDELVAALGARVDRLPVAGNMADLVNVHRIIQEYEFCLHLDATFTAHWDRISPSLRAAAERGRKIPLAQYEDSMAVMDSATGFFAKFFNDYDAVVTPSAAGQAPLFADGTGDPVFCTIWTLAGLPSINLPLLVGDKGLPIGVQLVGAAEQDDRLLTTANWMIHRLQGDTAPEQATEKDAAT